MKNKCIDCKCEISQKATRCLKCLGLLKRGNGSPHFKHGKNVSWKKHYCIDCGQEIDSKGRATRCKSCAKIGNLNSNFGNHKLLGENNPCFGKYGKAHPAYTNGNSSLNQLVRRTLEYKSWRTLVFQRDNFTCKECFVQGRLEAHHKKEFHSILEEFLKLFPTLDSDKDKYVLIYLAIFYRDFWDIDNGVTLCEECHKLTRI